MIENAINKIVVWGDSITKGIVQGSEGKQYVVNPENSLKMAGKELGIEIINHSYFGCTIGKGTSVLLRDFSKEIQCDAAIIEFGGNDCDFHWKEISENPDGHHEPRTPLDAFSKNLRNIISTLKEHHVTPILMNLVPLVPERYFKHITQELNAENILKWLGDIDFLYRWHESYSTEIVNIARSENCLLLDIRRQFLMEHNYQRLLCEDGIHPNAEGQLFMKNYFIQAGKSEKFRKALL